jgi:tryptophan-rich sensory protein
MIASSARRSPSRARILSAIAVSVGIAAITNGLLAVFGLNRVRSEHWPAFAPPGPVIGIVWIALFAGMGAAYALAPQKRSIAILIALCLAYPFYTHLAGGHVAELAGNVVTFAYAVWLMAKLRASSPAATLLVALVAAWIAFATLLVVALGNADGW